MAMFTLRQFHDIIQRHNRGLHQLLHMRSLISRHADAMADYLTQPRNYPQAASWRNRRNQVRDCFQHLSAYRGNARVFQQWNGWWLGTWHGGSNTPQFHIWDETLRSQSQSPFIQPVTQSTHHFIDSDNLSDATASPLQFHLVDLGINVWSSSNGITGWVSKRQLGDEELPHIGYRLDANTLLWITQRNFQGNYWMFYEWVDGGRQRYGIYGRKFRLPSGSQTRVHDEGYLGRAEYQKGRPVPFR